MGVAWCMKGLGGREIVPGETVRKASAARERPPNRLRAKVTPLVRGARSIMANLPEALLDAICHLNIDVPRLPRLPSALWSKWPLNHQGLPGRFRRRLTSRRGQGSTLSLPIGLSFCSGSHCGGQRPLSSDWPFQEVALNSMLTLEMM